VKFSGITGGHTGQVRYWSSRGLYVYSFI